MDYLKNVSENSITFTLEALTKNSFIPTVVETKEEALEKIKALIPKGVSVNNGTSQTLVQIGFVDYLKNGAHGWHNLHEEILKETDQARQGMLRKQRTVSDYYLGSVHALTEKGELVISSATGSQLPALAYNAQNLILVVSDQKIVPTISDAFDRLDKRVIPLEDERMKAAYGMGTMHAKTLILRAEHPMMQRKAHIIIVKEPLGF